MLLLSVMCMSNCAVINWVDPIYEKTADTEKPSVVNTSSTQVLGTTSTERGTGLIADASGNLYITGYTYGNLDSQTNNGFNDIFLLKYDATGVKQWTKLLGTNNYEGGLNVTTDSSGNVYVTGYTAGALEGQTNAGSDDIFVTKYDSAGNTLWTKLSGTANSDEGLGITTDTSGNIYVTGYTSGSLDGQTHHGGKDIFILKYDAAGTKTWTKLLGTANDERGAAITTDASGNIYITGKTSGALDSQTNTGSDDIFIAKYDSTGTKQWTKLLGVATSDAGSAITTDAAGSIYITGQTSGTLDGETNAGSDDIFIAKFDSSGSKQWTKLLGTANNDQAYGLAADAAGAIYVTGKTAGALDGQTNAGSDDVFIAKFDSAGSKQWTRLLGSIDNDGGNDVIADAAGNVWVTGYTYGSLDGQYNAGSDDLFLIKYDAAGNKQ